MREQQERDAPGSRSVLDDPPARREALGPARPGLRLVEAELGTDAGLLGAGLLAFGALGPEH